MLFRSANINATYAPTTYSDITVTVVDASSPSTVLATLTPAAANVENLVTTFTLSAPKDVQVRVNFNAGLNVAVNSSVIVSGVAVYSGSYTLLTVPEYEQDNSFWTPGGLYQPSTFNYPRNVTVVPIDVNGLPISMASQDLIHDYLESHREINFKIGRAHV